MQLYHVSYTREDGENISLFVGATSARKAANLWIEHTWGDEAEEDRPSISPVPLESNETDYVDTVIVTAVPTVDPAVPGVIPWEAIQTDFLDLVWP